MKAEDENTQPLVFISHQSQDADLARVLREWIDDSLIGGVRFFVSTDYTTLPLGVNFHSAIEDSLAEAAMMIVLVTRRFVKSGWMFFEAGAAVSRRIPLVPVCFGIKPSALPEPLKRYQGVMLDSDESYEALLSEIAKLANLRPKLTQPYPKFGKMAEEESMSNAPYELHHMSVAVSDLAESRKFYGIALGLEEIERPEFRYNGVPFGGAWYKLPSGQQLHLVVHPEGAPKNLHPERIPSNPEELDYRNIHFALRVGHVCDTEKRLKDAGFMVICKSPSYQRFPQLYVLDPDGNIVEINEWSDVLP